MYQTLHTHHSARWGLNVQAEYQQAKVKLSCSRSIKRPSFVNGAAQLSRGGCVWITLDENDRFEEFKVGHLPKWSIWTKSVKFGVPEVYQIGRNEWQITRSANRLNIIRLALSADQITWKMKSRSPEENFAAHNVGRDKRLKVSSWFSTGGDDTCQSSGTEDLYTGTKASPGLLRETAIPPWENVTDVVIKMRSTRRVRTKRVVSKLACWSGSVFVSPRPRRVTAAPLLNDTSAVIAVLGDCHP